MFMVNSVARGLERTIANEGGLHSLVVSGEIYAHIIDIRRYIPEGLWLLILLKTFRYLIADNVDLSAIGDVCINLQGLDTKDKFPFHEVIDTCFSNNRDKLIQIIDLFELEKLE